MNRLTVEDVKKLESEGFVLMQGNWGPGSPGDAYGCAVTALILRETDDIDRTDNVITKGIDAYSKYNDEDKCVRKTAQWEAIGKAIRIPWGYIAGLESGFEDSFCDFTPHPEIAEAYALGMEDGKVLRNGVMT